MKKMILLVFLAMILSSCSVSTIQVVDTEQLQTFKKNSDFQSDEIQKYKVGSSVIYPIFRNLGPDTYSFYLAAYSDVEGEKTFKVYSTKIIYDVDGETKDIEKQIEASSKYKLSSDKTSWKKDVYYSGYGIYEEIKIDFKDASKIKLIADVAVADGNGEERKKIEYDLKYREDKYITELSQ